MNYYKMHYTGLKKVDEKTYLKDYKPSRDVIDWYDDGENIFYGAPELDEKDVIFLILITIGNINLNCCLWGI